MPKVEFLGNFWMGKMGVGAGCNVVSYRKVETKIFDAIRSDPVTKYPVPAQNGSACSGQAMQIDGAGQALPAGNQGEAWARFPGTPR
jgi:hypothetical protein